MNEWRLIWAFVVLRNFPVRCHLNRAHNLKRELTSIRNTSRLVFLKHKNWGNISVVDYGSMLGLRGIQTSETIAEPWALEAPRFTSWRYEPSAWQQRLIWAHWESLRVTCGGRRSNGRQQRRRRPAAADFSADPRLHGDRLQQWGAAPDAQSGLTARHGGHV